MNQWTTTERLCSDNTTFAMDLFSLIITCLPIMSIIWQFWWKLCQKKRKNNTSSKFSSRNIVLDRAPSNRPPVDRHTKALCLRFNQVLLYGAVRHTLPTKSTRYPAVCLVCSKLSALIFGWRRFVLIYSTRLKINAQSSNMTRALRCYYKEV